MVGTWCRNRLSVVSIIPDQFLLQMSLSLSFPSLQSSLLIAVKSTPKS